MMLWALSVLNLCMSQTEVPEQPADTPDAEVTMSPSKSWKVKHTSVPF